MASSIEQLIGKQIALGELKRRLEPKIPGESLAGGGYGPCVVVSRLCGSGGTSLARVLSERLKWQVFDREIVEEVARSAHVREHLIESVDERVRSGWTVFFHKLAQGDGYGRESYLHHLRQVIRALGHHGNAIILGRGAAYILPRDTILSVRLVAPLEMRAQRVAEREKISLSKAQQRVEQIDAERAAFVREAFGRDVNAEADYDLVLDMGGQSLEAAAEIVLTKLQEKLHVQPETAPCGK
jgi:cytidylate kinase